MKCLFEGCRKEAIDDGNYCSEHEWDYDTSSCSAEVGDPPPPGEGGEGDPPPPGSAAG